MCDVGVPVCLWPFCEQTYGYIATLVFYWRYIWDDMCLYEIYNYFIFIAWHSVTNRLQLSPTINVPQVGRMRPGLYFAYWGRHSQVFPARKLLYPGAAKPIVINKPFLFLNRPSGRMFGGGNQFIIVILPPVRGQELNWMTVRPDIFPGKLAKTPTHSGSS